MTESAPEIDKRKEKESGADGKRKREHPETENESEAADRPENPGKNRAVPTQRNCFIFSFHLIFITPQAMGIPLPR